MWRWGWKARAEGWRRAMQNRFWCTVAGKSKLVVSVSHTSAAFASLCLFYPCCAPSSLRREGKATRSHAAGRWLNRDFPPSNRDDKNNRNNECSVLPFQRWLVYLLFLQRFISRVFYTSGHEFVADFVCVRTKMIFER